MLQNLIKTFLWELAKLFSFEYFASSFWNTAMFKIFGFKVRKIIIINTKEIYPCKSRRMFEKLIDSNNIICILKHDVLSDYYMVFKNAEDINLLKLITDKQEYRILERF